MGDGTSGMNPGDDGMLEFEIESMQKRYNKALCAQVGATIECPTCGMLIVKKSSQHKFCKDRTCKDRYWNTTDDERRERAKIYS